MKQDELTLLRKVRDDVAEPSAAALNTGRAALLDAAAPVVASPAKRHRGLKRAGWTTLGVVAAGGLAVTLVLTNVVGLAGWRGGADPAAADTLAQAALAAIHNSDPVVGPGQYLKVAIDEVDMVTIGVNDGNFGYLSENKISRYVPADPADVWVEVDSVPTVYQTFGARSKELAEQNYRTVLDQIPNGDMLRAPGGRFYGSSPAVTPAKLASMPRDPRLLLNSIYAATIGQGYGPDPEAFVFITDTLRSGIVPADLRAALYRAAALIPGVRITQEQATLDGRTGVAIGVDQGTELRDEIVIDPSTGLMIGVRNVLLKASAGVPAGTVFEFSAITTSVVDSAPTGGTVCGAGMTLTKTGCKLNG